jgi:hypothetical protein
MIKKIWNGRLGGREEQAGECGGTSRSRSSRSPNPAGPPSRRKEPPRSHCTKSPNKKSASTNLPTVVRTDAGAITSSDTRAGVEKAICSEALDPEPSFQKLRPDAASSLPAGNAASALQRSRWAGGGLPHWPPSFLAPSLPRGGGGARPELCALPLPLPLRCAAPAFVLFSRKGPRRDPSRAPAGGRVPRVSGRLDERQGKPARIGGAWRRLLTGGSLANAGPFSQPV